MPHVIGAKLQMDFCYQGVLSPSGLYILITLQGKYNISWLKYRYPMPSNISSHSCFVPFLNIFLVSVYSSTYSFAIIWFCLLAIKHHVLLILKSIPEITTPVLGGLSRLSSPCTTDKTRGKHTHTVLHHRKMV